VDGAPNSNGRRRLRNLETSLTLLQLFLLASL